MKNGIIISTIFMAFVISDAMASEKIEMRDVPGTDVVPLILERLPMGEYQGKDGSKDCSVTVLVGKAPFGGERIDIAVNIIDGKYVLEDWEEVQEVSETKNTLKVYTKRSLWLQYLKLKKSGKTLTVTTGSTVDGIRGKLKPVSCKILNPYQEV